MKNTQFCYLVLLASALFLFSNCTDDDQKRQQHIDRLEKSLSRGTAAQPQIDSLIALYRETVAADKASSDKKIAAATRAAELQYTFNSDINAVRWVLDALKTYPDADSLVTPFAFLGRIWRDYSYKTPTVGKMDPDDIDGVKAVLLANQPKLDTVLMRLDKSMKGPETSDTTAADQFVIISEAYSSLLTDKNPVKAGDLLDQAAAVARNIGNFNKAVQLYYRVNIKFPQHPKAPQALFLQGFIYDNDLSDYKNAEKVYKEFLERYPKDELADDAAALLKNLGKTPEEILQSFQKQNIR